MKLLQRLFPPKPVRQAIACLDELRPLFEHSPFVSLGFDSIRNAARTAFLRDPDKVCRHAQEPGYPRIACLRAIATIARHDLLSGREHIAAGFYKHSPLSMEGSGKRAVYSIALAELVKLGALTAEDREKFCRELDEDIREIG
jgi:hypothetical protein